MNPSRILVPCLTAVVLAIPAASVAAAPVASTSGSGAAHSSTHSTAGSSTGSVLSWKGRERKVTLPVTAEMIPGAPSSFRQFARAQLRETWQGFLHGRPACKTAPDFNVYHLSTAGYAYGDAGTYPVKGCQTGGGYVAFWAIRHGEWKQVIGTQDVASCARLDKLGFPSSVATVQCYDGQDVIDYSHP